MTATVPIGAPPVLSLVLEALAGRLTELEDVRDLVLLGFACWLGVATEHVAQALSAAMVTAAAHDGAARRYHDVAVLGFAGAARVAAGHEPAVTDRFRAGLAWLQGRQFFSPSTPLGLEADGLALLGIAAGIAAMVPPESRAEDARWLSHIANRSLQLVAGGPSWDLSLLVAAKLALRDGTADTSPTWSLVPDLAAALASLGLASLDEAGELAALRLIVTPESLGVPLEQAVARLAGLRWLLRRGAAALPKRATVEDVVTVLAGLPHALKRWPWEDKPKTRRAGVSAQRWDIQNEYHVQSLLWAILAPLFPEDIEDEEYLHSLGHKHPRVDLAIPSLGLIIEVKFVLEGTTSAFAGIVGEISSDTGLYLSKPSRFTEIVAFIWDDSGASQHHTELLSGLRSLTGVRDAVVVSRPGTWEPRARG